MAKHHFPYSQTEKGQCVQPERFSFIPLTISKVRTEGHRTSEQKQKISGCQSTAVRNNDLAINDKDLRQFAK